MRRIIDNDLLTMIFRLAVGGMFVYASFYKIMEPADFAKSIWYYHIVPGELINLMALTLPWIELLAGCGLIFGVYYRGSTFLISLMTVVFVAALVSAVARGLDIECGCFKASGEGGGTALSALWRNIVTVVLLVQLWVTRSRRWMVKPKTSG